MDFRQGAMFLLTTVASDGTTVSQTGLKNPSIHIVEYIRWQICIRILNRFKGAICFGLSDINMFVPVEFRHILCFVFFPKYLTLLVI